MKIIKQRRVIRPAAGSKAKVKDGLFTQTLCSDMSPMEFFEWGERNKYKTPSEHLNEIIAKTTEYLNQFPDLATEQKTPEPLSPEYFASRALAYARSALYEIGNFKDGRIDNMLNSSMLAVNNFQRFLFALQFEFLVLGGLSQKVKKTPRNNSWAKKIAKSLKKKYPESTFSERWSAIPDDEEWDGWAVEFELDKVSGEKVALLAEYVKDDKVKKKPQRITKETFRTDYMTDRKKKNKK